MLLSTVLDRLGPDAVRTGTRLTGFTSTHDDVTAHTASGAIAARMLVGADGVHSVVRSALHPDTDPLMWSGVRMFRGVTRGQSFLDGRTMAIVKGAHGVDLVVYPIGDGLTNWVVQVPESNPGPLSGDVQWNAPADRVAVLALLADWRLGWLDPAGLVRDSDIVLQYPMVDRNVLPWWGHNRVTLLGDAAHPMYPVGANGGSQAILDARVLAEELSADPDGGLRTYEAKRRQATAEIVAANREMYTSGAAAQRPQDLADIAQTYRARTGADRRQA
jgi:2-polyprenyl-6-methoxyphenol hydroxylase-like FAD-dependent oxidoreductase